MRFDAAACAVLVDYAHNPEGLRGLLTRGRPPAPRQAAGSACCSATPATARMPISRSCARVAAGFHPDLVVVKEDEAHLRGRAPGRVPRIIHAELLRAGLPGESRCRMSHAAKRRRRATRCTGRAPGTCSRCRCTRRRRAPRSWQCCGIRD